ncbi:hypothetical protein [Pseudalkalibacillus hwajinpoensis]|uniref:hypothetical protein n=1 Tax=Guptibacillus hwajinpoensis TaxID=208199 RepID=UPI00384BE225
MSIGILALVTMALAITQSYELIKPEEKQNNRKIIALTFLVTLLTAVLTIDLIKNFIV